eukprot:contig_17603_g4313
MATRVSLWGRSPLGLVTAFLARLRAAFGWRFVVVLASTYVGVRGILGGLTSAAYLPYMRVKVGVTDAPTYQALRTVVWLPWSLKPLMGMVSDVAPIRGYGKRYYILGSVVLGTVAAAVLAAAPVSTLGGGAAAAVLMFVVCAQVVCIDILVQGAYSRLMVENPQTGSDVVSAVWGFIFLGALAGSGLVALIGERHPSLYYWAAIGFALQVGVPVAVGWLPEARTANGLRVDMLRTRQPFFMLAAFVTAAATGLGAVSLWATPLVQASYAVSVGVVLCVAALYLLPSMIGKALVYLFLSTSLSLNIRGAVDVFYTGSAECVPGGPAFSLAFYQAWTTMVACVAGGVGVSIFQTFLSRTWYRRAFWVTTAVEVAAAVVDISLVNRWNLRLGISDKLFYVLGDSMLESVLEALDALPASVLMSKLCPPGIEATVFALLMGCSNFGRAVASSVGAFALHVAGIETPSSGRCNLDNLCALVVLGKVCLPLLRIPLTFVLIPDVKMTADLVGAVAVVKERPSCGIVVEGGKPPGALEGAEEEGGGRIDGGRQEDEDEGGASGSVSEVGSLMAAGIHR